jgi:hypothetical protein
MDCNALAAAALRARYFFHVHESVDMIDRVGNEFSGSEEDLREAVVAAGEVLRDARKVDGYPGRAPPHCATVSWEPSPRSRGCGT